MSTTLPHIQFSYLVTRYKNKAFCIRYKINRLKKITLFNQHKYFVSTTLYLRNGAFLYRYWTDFTGNYLYDKSELMEVVAKIT